MIIQTYDRSHNFFLKTLCARTTKAIGGKENYCRILLFKNAQYGKDSQKENWYGRFLWKKSAKEFVFSKLQIYSIYFTSRGLLFQRFFWNILKLLVLIIFRTSLGCYYLCWKTCKEQSDYYLLTDKMLENTIIFVKILQKAYHSA